MSKCRNIQNKSDTRCRPFLNAKSRIIVLRTDLFGRRRYRNPLSWQYSGFSVWLNVSLCDRISLRSTIDEKRKLVHAEDAEPAENNLNIFHSSASSAGSARNPLIKFIWVSSISRPKRILKHSTRLISSPLSLHTYLSGIRNI